MLVVSSARYTQGHKMHPPTNPEEINLQNTILNPKPK